MDEKPRLLVGLFKHMDPRRTMVFVNTRRGAEDLQQLLQSNGINAEAISGDVPQRKRLRMLRDFHDGTLAVLIGTDVASRGLHIPEVSHVFNYDLPQDPEDYVHRIGRTARAGAEGDAISLGCEEYVMSLPDIEAYIGRKLPVAPIPLELLAELTPQPPRPPRTYFQRGRPGDRRPGSGGPRHNGNHRQEQRRPPPPRQQPAPRAAAPAPVVEQTVKAGSEADAPRKRRRRRRGPKPEGTGAATTPEKSNSEVPLG
jgi:ATP-dependent RNA helicase RhlB